MSLEQIRAFLDASEEVGFEATDRKQIYEGVKGTLCEQEYWKQSKAVKGWLRAYVQKMTTGLSRVQVIRLIAQCLETGGIEEKPYRRHRFAQRYTRVDIELLAEVDEAHETLSGPAARQILQREFEH